MVDDLNLKSQVLSEVELLEMLNVEQPTLDKLRREKDFPYIRLSSRCRVYLGEEVLDWLKKNRISQSKYTDNNLYTIENKGIKTVQCNDMAEQTVSLKIAK